MEKLLAKLSLGQLCGSKVNRKCFRRHAFVQVLPQGQMLPLEATAGGLQLAGRPCCCPCFPTVPDRPHAIGRTPVHPLTELLPVLRSSRPAGGGAVRSRQKHRSKSGPERVHSWFTAGLRAVPVCDGSAGGGKTAASGERGPGTAVVGHETGRRHLGTVPRHGDPCLASCLAINDRW